MTCTEFLAKMTDFFDGTMAKDLEAEVRQHMCECDHCEVVVNTTRQTIEIYRDTELFELPANLRESLISRIMERCKERDCGCGESIPPSR